MSSSLDWVNSCLASYGTAQDLAYQPYDSLHNLFEEHEEHVTWLSDHPEHVTLGNAIKISPTERYISLLQDIFIHPIMYGSWIALIAMNVLDIPDTESVLSIALETDLIIGARFVDNVMHVFFTCEEGLVDSQTGNLVRCMLHADGYNVESWEMLETPSSYTTVQPFADAKHPYLDLTDVQQSTVAWLLHRLHVESPIQSMFIPLIDARSQTVYYSPSIECIVQELPDIPTIVSISDEAMGKDTALCVYLRMAIDRHLIISAAIYTHCNAYSQWISKLDMLQLLPHVTLFNIDMMQSCAADVIVFDNLSYNVNFELFSTTQRIVHLWPHHLRVSPVVFCPPTHPFATIFKETKSVALFELRHDVLRKRKSVETVRLQLTDPAAYRLIRNHFFCLLSQDVEESPENIVDYTRQRVGQLQIVLNGLAPKTINMQLLSMQQIHTGDDCSVCMQDVMCLPTRVAPCSHVFCRSCITTWLKQNHSCPLCRQFVDNLVSMPTQITSTDFSFQPFMEKLHWLNANLVSRTVIFTQYTTLAKMLKNTFTSSLILLYSDLSTMDIGPVDLIVMMEPIRNKHVLAFIRRLATFSPQCKIVALMLENTLDTQEMFLSTSSLTTLQNVFIEPV